MSALSFRHAKLIQAARAAGVTVEDMARAWASIDGKRDEFDIGRESPDIEAGGGHYAGYLSEAEEMLKRATLYASERK
jgi:hypothetical protein